MKKTFDLKKIKNETCKALFIEKVGSKSNLMLLLNISTRTTFDFLKGNTFLSFTFISR